MYTVCKSNAKHSKIQKKKKKNNNTQKLNCIVFWSVPIFACQKWKKKNNFCLYIYCFLCALDGLAWFHRFGSHFIVNKNQFVLFHMHVGKYSFNSVLHVFLYLSFDCAIALYCSASVSIVFLSWLMCAFFHSVFIYVLLLIFFFFSFRLNRFHIEYIHACPKYNCVWKEKKVLLLISFFLNGRTTATLMNDKMLTKYQLDRRIHGLHTKEHTESHHQITHFKKKYIYINIKAPFNTMALFMETEKKPHTEFHINNKTSDIYFLCNFLLLSAHSNVVSCLMAQTHG